MVFYQQRVWEKKLSVFEQTLKHTHKHIICISYWKAGISIQEVWKVIQCLKISMQSCVGENNEWKNKLPIGWDSREAGRLYLYLWLSKSKEK